MHVTYKLYIEWSVLPISYQYQLSVIVIAHRRQLCIKVLPLHVMNAFSPINYIASIVQLRHNTSLVTRASGKFLKSRAQLWYMLTKLVNFSGSILNTNNAGIDTGSSQKEKMPR